MERRWLISAMAAMAVLSTPALAESSNPEEVTPAPGTPVAEAPATPAPAAEGDKLPEAKEEKAAEKPVQVAGNPMPTPPKPGAAGETGAGTGTPGAGATTPVAPPAEAPKFTFGGYADFYFSSNFNDPSPAYNGFAAYDFQDEHGPHLNYIELWAQYARDPIGFRLDVGWGLGGRITNFLECTISKDDIWDHVQQAYISANLNNNGRLFADFGRWTTPAGAEVIDSRDNWLYSRGIIFNLSGPFTHTGLKVTQSLGEADYISGYVTTGWDRVSLVKTGPGFGITGSKVMSPKLTLTGTYMGGKEFSFDGDGSEWRNFIDIVAAYNASSKWQYTANFELGQQDDAIWYGLSVQGRYNLNAKSFLAARGEFLSDDDGVRFGDDGTGYGFTLGYTYNWNKYFQTRVEYRHDFFTDDFFNKNGTSLVDDQGRFIVAAVIGY